MTGSDFEPGESEIGEAEKAAIGAAVTQSVAIVDQMRRLLDQVDSSRVTLDAFLEMRGALGMKWGELDRQARNITTQFGFSGALDCLRIYMLNHIGEPIENYQLAGAACALEWARRIRQLDVEHGWRITTGGSGVGGLAGGQYRLESDIPEHTRAARWAQLNSIRRMPGGAPNRILVLLQTLHPEPVTRSDLDYVAKIQSRDRRVRYLEEEGWDISGHDDDPSLPEGTYRLNSLTKGPPRSREAIKERTKILKAANYTCEQCGAQPEKGHKPVHLQIHHRVFVREGGTNVEENLQVLCRACHAGVHALSESGVEDELLNPAADPDRP
jgi:hypothetical protein